jgi:hypothetical protein
MKGDCFMPPVPPAPAPNIKTPKEVYRLIHAMEITATRTARVSPHFTWGELLVNRTADELQSITLEHLNNLARLADALEGARQRVGNRSITITSGWRDTLSNQRVGGARASRHLLGEAADITVAGLTPQEVQKALDPTWAGGLGYGATFTHLDVRPYYARFRY